MQKSVDCTKPSPTDIAYSFSNIVRYFGIHAAKTPNFPCCGGRSCIWSLEKVFARL